MKTLPVESMPAASSPPAVRPMSPKMALPIGLALVLLMCTESVVVTVLGSKVEDDGVE